MATPERPSPTPERDKEPKKIFYSLPEFVALKPVESPPQPEGLKEMRERGPIERAQEMWDIFQDLKRSWMSFLRNSRPKKPGPEEPVSGANQEARVPVSALWNPEDPLAKQFLASPMVKALGIRLHALYTDPETRAAWEQGMQAHAAQWEGVNGTWQEYQEVKKQMHALEARYDALQKEKFNERGVPQRDRRRTLADDLAAVELALADARGAESSLRTRSPELAAKILASELAERHRELQSPEGFMMFPSRRAAIEAFEALVSDKETLRMIVLEGEAGTGKTSMVRAIARRFTGEDPIEFTLKETTKVDRILLADEPIDPATQPSAYGPVLYGITGKRFANSAPEHNGRAVFVDEVNKGSNSEVGELVTPLDGMQVAGQTRYALRGANPKDKVQRRALVIGAQNPAGARFLHRTKFTPEVARKIELIQLDYFPQTHENPELFEALLVAFKDQDGRIQAKKSELAPAWIKDSIKNSSGVEIGTQDKLVTVPKEGGMLWRFTEMLHQSYENLYKRKNALTSVNPDAHIQGRVLPPGDVFKWLQSYRREVKKGVSLESYLSRKFMDWIASSFTADHDQEDKRLYLALAEQYGIVQKAGAEYQALPEKKISIDLLTPRDIAELSPRVPRPMIPKEGAPRAGEYPRAFVDLPFPDGTVRRGVEIRYEPFPRPQKFKPKGSEETYLAVGIVKECKDVPALVGTAYLQKTS